MKKLTLIIALTIFLNIGEAFAEELVKFSLENRRMQGDVYLVDVMAEPGSKNWLVGGCNIIVKFNEDALSLEGLENAPLLDQGLLTSDEGYKVDQTNYDPGLVSLNIFNINPVRHYAEKEIVGTLRFNIKNAAGYDNLEFVPEETEIFDNKTLLEYGRNDSKGYTVVNPEPVAPNNLISSVNDGHSGSLTVSPIPAGEEITVSIEADLSATASLEIIDASGKTVYNGKPNGRATKVNCKDFTAGAYIVQIKDGKKIYKEKIIVK